jgi:hypothetical protein
MIYVLFIFYRVSYIHHYNIFASMQQLTVPCLLSCNHGELHGSMQVKRISPAAFIPIGEWTPERGQIEELKADLKDTQSRCFQEWMKGVMFEREIMELKEQLAQKNHQITRLMKKNAKNAKKEKQ